MGLNMNIFKHFSPESLKELKTKTRQQIALAEKRIERLRQTEKKRPDWQSFDKYIGEQVGIDIRIEEQQASLGESEGMLKQIETELDRRRGLNQTMKMELR